MNSVHRSSSGCHVAHGDVAPETVVSNTFGGYSVCRFSPMDRKNP
jgi:hypothetical protein